MRYTPYVRPEMKTKAMCALGGTSSVFFQTIGPMPGVLSPSFEVTCGVLGARCSSWSGAGGERVFKALCLGKDRVISGGKVELSHSQP